MTEKQFVLLAILTALIIIFGLFAKGVFIWNSAMKKKYNVK